MNKKDLAALIALGTIATENVDGFTIDAKTFEPVKHGYAVALEGTQNSFGLEGMAKVYNYVNKYGVNAIGGWLNTDNNQYYFDATVVVDSLEKAIEIGKINHQIAIFDLDNCKEIRL